MKIGELIKDKREGLQMNQEQLAKTIGTTAATISRWESGNIQNIKPKNINALSKSLGIDTQLFFQREEILMPEEYDVIRAYRKAGVGTKNSVRKLLDLSECEEVT